MGSSLYETHLQGIMGVADTQRLGLMDTTTMIPCRHISQRERVIV